MSAPEPSVSWANPVVRAPQALGLGAPRTADGPVAVPAPTPEPPPEPPPAPAAPSVPKAVRLPSASSDQEGIYEGLLWVVRGLEECGRAFTRLSGRLGKVEGRVAALEAQAPASASRKAGLEQRVQRLEAAAASAPVTAAPAPSRVVPLRMDYPELATLRRELATTQVRLARLEGSQRKAEHPVTALEEQVGALEHDLVGVYRELDGVAQQVDNRLASLLSAVGDLAARMEQVAARAQPQSDVERRLAALEAKIDRAVSPRSQAEGLRTALEEVLGRDGGTSGRPAAAPARLVDPPAPLPAAVPTPAAAREWARSELARPALDLTPPDVRSRAASVLSAELDRIRSSLDALGAEVPGR